MNPELSADYERLQKQVDSLKRKVAKLTAERDWAEQERAITTRWAEQSWEQVRHLRELLDKAITMIRSSPVVIPNPPPLPNPLPPPTWQNPPISQMTTGGDTRTRLQQSDGTVSDQ